MRYQLPRAAAERRGRQLADNREGKPGRHAARPELPAPTKTVLVVPEKPPTRVAADTGTAQHPVSRQIMPHIGPGLAEGRLWVRPLPLPPQELAQKLSRSHAQLVDSAVSAIVQAYLASIPNDPATRDEGMPSWTTQIAGKKFGIDSKHIYIAGLKTPAAVLALLPIPAGNIDQNRAYSHLMDMRADLMYAARRAETMEEFKQVIKEIRQRKEKEREFEKNQRTAPPPEKPATP